MKHLKTFAQGSQGMTGLMCDKNGRESVYKVSQFMTYLVDHEYLVMKGLSELASYCPHFCQVYDKITYDFNPEFTDPECNPFAPSSNPVSLRMLSIENIAFG